MIRDQTFFAVLPVAEGSDGVTAPGELLVGSGAREPTEAVTGAVVVHSAVPARGGWAPRCRPADRAGPRAGLASWYKIDARVSLSLGSQCQQQDIRCSLLIFDLCEHD